MSKAERKFLEIVDFKKGFGNGDTRQEVLCGMNFSVAKGEFCVLLGPSGSGKSTLLNIIGGIDSADSGYISINGDRLKDMDEKKLTQYRRKHLGYVFQMYNLIDFDALKFDVAMVTGDGFNRLNKTIHYAYAWQYTAKPVDEKEEKSLSDNFLKALLTQTIVGDKNIEDYMPAYANPAINFATDDMGSDEAMGGVLLDILIVIIAFIFAVTISNTIVRESSALGTLRALGYNKGELVRHYLSMPVVVTLLSAGIGNILGYTVFKNVVVAMYYNSYSLPVYETIWNPYAFFKTTLT